MLRTAEHGFPIDSANGSVHQRAMRKITLMILVAAVLLAAVVFIRSLSSRAVHVRLGQKEIDAIVTRQFPIEKTHLKVVSITYSDPQATLVPESNQVRVGVNATVRAGIPPFEKEYQTGVTLLCGLAYDGKQNKLCLTHPLCERFDLPVIPETYREITKQALNITSITCFEKIPVYELKPRNKTQELAVMVLHDLQVKDDSLTFTLKLPETTP